MTTTTTLTKTTLTKTTTWKVVRVLPMVLSRPWKEDLRMGHADTIVPDVPRDEPWQG
jgi:hypothetical protein